MEIKYNNLSIYSKFFFVSLGAIPGALFRGFIADDLFLNIFGAMLLGFIVSFDFREHYKFIFGVGFCGSCTTFSGWIMQSLELLLKGDFLQAFSYLGSTLIFGLVSLSLGFYFGRKIKNSILHQ